ncbi:hypothetical protein AAG570_010882 [Ranatra chinensis]|uniref:Uncharacterized protein n=1 Tax=Ranatra chinensis TaxID=642074 RepID=A0ABD0Z7C2_9HEMI
MDHALNCLDIDFNKQRKTKHKLKWGAGTNIGFPSKSQLFSEVYIKFQIWLVDSTFSGRQEPEQETTSNERYRRTKNHRHIDVFDHRSGKRRNGGSSQTSEQERTARGRNAERLLLKKSREPVGLLLREEASTGGGRRGGGNTQETNHTATALANTKLHKWSSTFGITVPRQQLSAYPNSRQDKLKGMLKRRGIRRWTAALADSEEGRRIKNYTGGSCPVGTSSKHLEHFKRRLFDKRRPLGAAGGRTIKCAFETADEKIGRAIAAGSNHEQAKPKTRITQHSP